MSIPSNVVSIWADIIFSVLLAKRVAEKKAKVAAIKASHQKTA